MSEEKEEQQGFQVTDKRFSSKSEEERQQIIQQGDPKAEANAETKSKIEESPLNQQSTDTLPEVNFSALVFSLSTQAIIQLGEVEDPVTKERQQNLPQAKQTIDILGMLKEKTEGNLSPEEQSLLDNLLYDLRMRFIKLSK